MLVREKGTEEWEDSDFYTTTQYEYTIAESFAEYHYNQDPCNPDDFEMCVEVLNDDGEIKVFDVFAEATIRFDAEEREEDDEHA